MTYLPIQTPALLIDAAKVKRNLARVTEYARSHQLAYRPHVKTHKSAWVGALQVAGGAVGLSCATPREAEVMSGVTDDLLIAYPPIGGGRAERIVALTADARIGVMLDDVLPAEALSAALAGKGRSVRVLVEIDAGMKRTGISDVDLAIELASKIARLPGLNFDGFGFYPGHLRSAGSEVNGDLAAMSELVDRLSTAARNEGLGCSTISSGSTPLLWRSHEIDGVTEIRAGTAIYFDRTSVLGGVCDLSDCAGTVLATVVSTAVSGHAVVDAGVKALGREPVRGTEASGYACVADHPSYTVDRLSEEHGIINLGAGDWRPRVGDQLRLIPNHICVAVHNFDKMCLLLEDGGTEIRPVDARGR